ncbi:MAG: GGDEF domain-containing protein [Acidobacteriota bacterium]
MAGMPQKYSFMLYGVGLASGAPLGWFAISFLFPSVVSEWALYVYLFLGTSIAFGGFGYILGASHDRLMKSAQRDALTGLWNQRAFFEVARLLLSISERDETALALIMLDIDRFKLVNDRNSHLFGSYVLKEVAGILRTSTRKSDVVGRYGGDEFVICLPRTGADEAVAITERIRQCIEREEFRHGRYRAQVTVSLGVAEIRDGTSDDVVRLIESADRALYQAKAAGRNRVVLWNGQPVVESQWQ